MSTLVSREQVELDAFDLVEQIGQIRKRLHVLNEEYKSAVIGWRDGKYQVLIADAKLKALRSDIDTAKLDLQGAQSMLRALPR